ncbi:MAG: heme biosynthesis HemY N-terminal domain-containing protein [Alphaproteobacteria bacterium]
MIRLIWFITKFAVLIALAVWLAENPGEVRIVWNDYLVQTSAAFLLVCVLGLVGASLLVYRGISFLRYGRRGLRLRRQLRRQNLGLVHLSKGFSALASGDAAAAGAKAVAARKMLGQSSPLINWLQAQAAQLSGDHATAGQIFLQLSKDHDGAPIGYRGLIAASLRAHDDDKAAGYVEQFAAHHPKSPWLHVARYEIAARRGAWVQAAESLRHATARQLLNHSAARRQQAAAMVAEARAARAENQLPRALQAAEHAQNIQPDWLPARIELVRTQAAMGYTRLALKKIEKFWDTTPHPELGALYLELLGDSDALKQYKKVGQLAVRAPQHPVSLLLLAQAAMAAQLWGEAASNLQRAAEIAPTRQTYLMLAQLDKANPLDRKPGHDWLQQAATAPIEASWRCHHCGHQTPQWEINCPQCGALNGIDWFDQYTAAKLIPEVTPEPEIYES